MILVMRKYIYYHVSFGGGLHGNSGVGVNANAGVEDSVRDLIAKFVWMSLANGFGSEVNVASFVVLHCL